MSERTINAILTQLEGAFASLPEETIKACAEKIAAHGRVFVYGAGRSGLMLKALAMRLAQMGRCVYVVGETVTPAIEEGDLLILASASGQTYSVCRYAEIAKECGADALIITAAKASWLTAVYPADVCFDVPNKNSGAKKQSETADDAADSQGKAETRGQVMGSLFEQMVLLFGDAMVQYLAREAGEMRRRHANLE